MTPYLLRRLVIAIPVLFGVTMIEKGVSRLVSVDLQAAELLAAE